MPKAQKKPYKDSFDAVQLIDTGETECCKEPSQTIQGETVTIRELLNKHAMGQPIKARPGIYIDAELHDIDHYHRRDLDLTDIQKLKERNEHQMQKLQEAEKAWKQQQKEAEKAKAQKEQEQSEPETE